LSIRDNLLETSRKIILMIALFVSSMIEIIITKEGLAKRGMILPIFRKNSCDKWKILLTLHSHFPFCILMADLIT
jgi:hypothetical protein